MRIRGRASRAEHAWLEPPRLRTSADDAERHASWLGLFPPAVLAGMVAVLLATLIFLEGR